MQAHSSNSSSNSRPTNRNLPTRPAPLPLWQQRRPLRQAPITLHLNTPPPPLRPLPRAAAVLSRPTPLFRIKTQAAQPLTEFFEPRRGPRLLQQGQDLLAPNARADLASELKVRVEERTGGIEIDEPDAHIFQSGECGEGFDARDNERLERLDKRPVRYPRAVVPSLDVVPAGAGGRATAVLDDEVEGFETGGVAVAGEGGGMAGVGEEGAADAAGEGEGFELRGDAAERLADVMVGVEGAPFVRGGRFFAVEAFEADVEVREGWREGL